MFLLLLRGKLDNGRRPRLCRTSRARRKQNCRGEQTRREKLQTHFIDHCSALQWSERTSSISVESSTKPKLDKQITTKLAANGGKLPADIKT
jgi:hypothetical protein